MTLSARTAHVRRTVAVALRSNWSWPLARAIACVLIFGARRAITATALLLLSGSGMLYAGGTAYVSPSGNDNNPGNLAQPYRTIQKCATTVTSGGTCFILAGDYGETVTPNSGITIAPYQNQVVTVDGTNQVTGWTLFSGNIYRAAVTLSSGDTNQVFVNGQMMTEARWPKSYDLFRPVWATAQSGTTATTLADSNLPNINWVGAHVHFWSGSDPWDPQTAVITASQPGMLTFTVDGASLPPYIVPQPGGYYFLFGTIGALTEPGEWFYDSNAGYLYLYAPNAANPNTLKVTAKARPYGFDLSNASNVTIQGFNLFATTINTSSSSANNVINGITATYVSHFTTLPDNPGYPSSYWYDHLDDSGIILNGSGHVLENSTISYSAGNGVTIVGTNITVQNNLIHHVDYMANYDSGIAVEGSGNLITQNTIHDSGRFAIFPHEIFNNAVGATNLDISYNNLFNSMLMSRDGGEIYIGNPPCAVSSTIRYNWLHDTRSLYSGPADNFPLTGVYLDEDACGWQVYQNIAWNNEYYNIFIHGSTSGVTTPNNNQVYSNSVPDNSSTGYIWLQNVNVCGATAVYNNYVLVPPVQTGSACNVYSNGSTAPGANMMAGVSVGCNFAGCSTPPALNASPTSGQAPLLVNLLAAGFFPGSGPYTINFGDGTIGAMQGSCTGIAGVFSGPGGIYCSFTASHTYVSAGPYTSALLDSTNTILASVITTVTSGSGLSLPYSPSSMTGIASAAPTNSGPITSGSAAPTNSGTAATGSTSTGFMNVAGVSNAITIDVSGVPVREVLSALTSRFGLRYSSSADLSKPITGNYNGPLPLVVARVLNGYQYDLKYTEGSIEVEIFAVRSP